MAGARALVETTSLEATLLEDPMLLLNAVAAIAANALQGSSRMSAALGNPTTAHQILDEFEAGLRALWEADDDDS
jgi:hypothetical protein